MSYGAMTERSRTCPYRVRDERAGPAARLPAAAEFLGAPFGGIMKRWARCALLVTALASLPATLHAQAPPAPSTAAIRGRIVDAESGEPLYLVEVILLGTRVRA